MKLKTIRQIMGGTSAAAIGGAAGLGVEDATAPQELKNTPKMFRGIDRHGRPFAVRNPKYKKRQNRKLIAAGVSSLLAAPIGAKALPSLINKRVLSGIAKETKSFNRRATTTMDALKETRDSLTATLVKAKKSGNTKDFKEATRRLKKVNEDIAKVEDIIKVGPGNIIKRRRSTLFGSGGASKRLKGQLSSIFGKRKTMFGEKNIASSNISLDKDALKSIYGRRLEKTFPRTLV